MPDEIMNEFEAPRENFYTKIDDRLIEQLNRGELSDAAFCFYCSILQLVKLRHYSSHRRAELRKISISNPELVAHTGKSKRTIQRALLELVQANILKVEISKTNSKTYGWNNRRVIYFLISAHHAR